MLNQIMRYEPVVALCVAAGGSRLLEVGSGARGISRYMGTRWSLTACDLTFDDYGQADESAMDPRITRVVGSVLELPFADGSFDVVVALDLLEHIVHHERTRALHELRRVTSGRLIVGCPAGSEAFAADQQLARYYERFLRRPCPEWLTEHLANGFPAAADLHAAAGSADSLSSVGNVTVRRHGAIGAACGHFVPAPLTRSA